MQAETLAAIESIKSAVDLLRKHVGWDTSSDRVAAFEAQISAPDFWDNQENAQRVMREKTHLDQQISAITELETKLQDQIDLIELAEEENDIELVVEANAELTRLAEIAGLEKRSHQLRLKSLHAKIRSMSETSTERSYESSINH